MKGLFVSQRNKNDWLIDEEPISKREHDEAAQRVMKALGMFVGGAMFAFAAISGIFTVTEIADLAAETIASATASIALLLYGMS